MERAFSRNTKQTCSITTKKIKCNKVPWITNKIKELITMRDNLKRKAIVTKSETDWLKYKRARNEVNIELRKSKRNYYSTKIAEQKCNPKKAWSTINSLLGKQNKQSKINELRVGNNILNNPKDIAEGFNHYFANIGPNLAEKIQTSVCDAETYVKKATSEFTAFQPRTVNNAYVLLNGLSNNKATGLDKISCKIIKMAAPAIGDSLTYIFNQSVTLSSFPNDWKMARVIPLYKDGHRNIPGNYRPISVLPTISKIIERILYD